ncbi:radical SAM protein [Mumia zhuanghuii]|uniref:Radical SAM protein n=2 Tax=Mumia TaxID=1546255 RepID=A0ABW1QNW8_9ACTN|nr:MULTISPECIES: radical SAM protein [Mumia]KAA1425010.1 radical SAM protein [Mumia zhuanghuii]
MKYRLGPDGIHVFDRATGWNVLLDEIVVPEHQWSPGPRQVSIAVTNTCDLSCSYCYAPKHRAAAPAEQLCRWMAELDAAGTLGVGFGGGEPTHFRALPEVCAYAAEHTGLAVTLTTHGHRWDNQLVASLRGAVQFVRVSVDGVSDTYERLRGRTFPALLDKLGLISENFRMGLNCVVNSDTVTDLTAVAALAEQQRASELLLLPEQPTAARPGATSAVIELMDEWVRSYDGPVPLSISAHIGTSLPIAEPLPLESGLRSYAHIDASGYLRATSYSSVGVAVGEAGVLSALRELEEAEAA